jgi:hypothetical protein
MLNNIRHIGVIAIALTSILFNSCKREIGEIKKPEAKLEMANSSNGNSENSNFEYQEGEVILGDKLENPYTPEIMQQALENIEGKGVASLHPVEIKITYYYVKFSPKNWDEYDDLRLDSTLELSDLPFDYPVTQTGNYYHDPSIADSLPTFQYATVPVNYEFNDTIDYEILSPLYIPEVDKPLLGLNNDNEFFVDQLLDEAYKITGNYDDTIDMNCYPTLDFTPGGNIQINDTRLGTNYGMEGVKVRARRWFIIYLAQPDFFGNYRMKYNFKRKCNYSIFFETNHFNVKQNWHNYFQNGVCWIDGPKQKGDWNHVIANGFDRFAGHIFRAAYRYHYKDIGGLTRPVSFRNFLWTKTTYLAKNGDNVAGSNPIFMNGIKIWRFENSEGTEFDSDEIFSATCHETAHTTHSQKVGILNYAFVSRQIQESWPVAIEWYLSHREYAERGINNYGEWNYHPVNAPIYPNDQAYQYWTPSLSADYTSLFINLVDNINDNTLWFFTGTPNDQVTGYTFPAIESGFLRDVSGLSSLSTQLKNHKPVGVTDSQIDLLLGFY